MVTIRGLEKAIEKKDVKRVEKLLSAKRGASWRDSIRGEMTIRCVTRTCFVLNIFLSSMFLSFTRVIFPSNVITRSVAELRSVIVRELRRRWWRLDQPKDMIRLTGQAIAAMPTFVLLAQDEAITALRNLTALCPSQTRYRSPFSVAPARLEPPAH